MKTLLLLVAWFLLLVLSWPLALLALVLWPLVWLVALPFRFLAVAVSGLPALPPLAPGATVLRLYNKSDALDAASLQRERDDPARRAEHAGDALWVSARTGLGLDALRAGLRALAGAGAAGEAGGGFSARARHLEALDRAEALLLQGDAQLAGGQAELAAEELRRAQAALGEITAPVDADALLGRIFAGFCIGK